MKRHAIPFCIGGLMLAACTATSVEPGPAAEESVVPAASAPVVALVVEEIDRPTVRYYEIADT